jgi:hypothetical protein
MDKTAEQLNEDYKAINAQMRVLNGQRFEIYKKWAELSTKEQTESLKEMRTISMYHDLYLNDVDS